MRAIKIKKGRDLLPKRTFFFWKGALGDEALLSTYEGAVDKLLLGVYSPGDLEKLKGHDVYSFRLNDTVRLLFATHPIDGQEYLLLLDVLLNHDYENNRFLRHGVLKRYLRQNEAEFATAVVTGAAAVPSVKPQFIAVEDSARAEFTDRFQQQENPRARAIPLEYFKQQFIQLSHEQEGALWAALPAVLSGEAGSGKSCVAISILAEHAAGLLQTGAAAARPSLLYVCESPDLVETMQAVWHEHPLASTLIDGIVRFRTYNQLLEEQGLLQVNGQPQRKTIVGRPEFNTWYGAYAQAQRTQARVRSSPYWDIAPETAYQEFRVCSAHLDETSYRQLGDKQCLLSPEQKSWLYQAFLAYLSHCEHGQCLHPAFDNGPWRELFDLVVVDEAQDFSNLQLKRAYTLAKNGAVVFCMDSHQSLHDKRSKRPYLLQLLHEQKGQCSHVELTTTYRCPINIALVASEVIKLKQCLAGGIADRDESRGLISAIHEKDMKGRVLLFDNKTIETSEWGRLYKKGTNFAVVTRPENREYAKVLFNTRLVFTPEEIKGLEYDDVVAYQLFDDDIFAKIYRKTKEDDYSPVQPRHRAKPGNGHDDEFGPFLNTIYTSFTRAKHTLILCQEFTRNNNVLLTPIRTIIINEPMVATKPKTTQETTPSEWLATVKTLLRSGHRQQALDIYIHELGLPPERFDALLVSPIDTAVIEPLATAASAAPLKVVSPPKAIPSSLQPVLKSKSLPSSQVAIMVVLRDFTEKRLHHCLNQKEVDLQALSTPVVISGEPNQSFFCHVMRSSNKLKVLQACLETDADIKAKIATFASFKAILQQGQQAQLDGMDVLLVILLIHGTHLMAKREVKLWLRGALKKRPTSLLHYLMKNEAGVDLFDELLQQNPQMINDIPDITWLQQYTPDANHTICASSLHWLSSTGAQAGKKILKILIKKPGFMDKIPIAEWYTPIFHNTLTVEGVALLNELSQTTKLLATVPMNVWCSPIPEPSVLANTTTVYHLTRTPVGRKIFKDLLGIPNFLATFHMELLGIPRPHAAGSYANTSVLYWLTTESDGLVILKTLLNTPEAMARIPIEAWYYALPPAAGGLANSTPLSHLALSADGQEMLYDLIGHHPAWAAAIPMESWALKLMTGKSPLMNLAATPKGREILGQLRAIHVEKPESIALLDVAVRNQEAFDSLGSLVAANGLFHRPLSQEGAGGVGARPSVGPP